MLERDRTIIKDMMKKEFWTKWESCFYCNVPEKTWNRWAAEKEEGRADRQNFPVTYKRGKGPRARCFYKAEEVIAMVKSWMDA